MGQAKVARTYEGRSLVILNYNYTDGHSNSRYVEDAQFISVSSSLASNIRLPGADGVSGKQVLGSSH